MLEEPGSNLVYKNSRNCDNNLIRPSLRKDKVAADRASRRSHYKVLYDQNKPTMYVQTGESASGNSLQNPLQGKVLAVMQEEMLPPSHVRRNVNSPWKLPVSSAETKSGVSSEEFLSIKESLNKSVQDFERASSSHRSHSDHGREERRHYDRRVRGRHSAAAAGRGENK